jgi:plastocyanin
MKAIAGDNTFAKHNQHPGGRLDMQPRVRFGRTRVLVVALAGSAVALSGLGFLLRAAPAAKAVDGPHVAIAEPNPNDAKTFKYDPANITVKAGTTIVWDWKGKDKHSVTADDGSFDSGTKTGQGLRWDHKFDQPGDYNYSCTPHSNMTGVVHVTP